MSAEDLYAAVEAAAKEVGADKDATIPGICQALDALGLDTMALFSAWGDGKLGRSPPDPTHIAALVGQVLGVAGTGLGDTVKTRATILRAALAAGRFLRNETADTGSTKENELGRTAYDDLHSLQGRYLPISRHTTFVGEARRSILKVGYIEESPSLGNTRLRGCANQGKRSLGEGVAILVTDGAPSPTTTVQECLQLGKCYVWGWCASATVKISATAFGGGEAGWISSPGMIEETRVALTAAAAERWIEVASYTTYKDPAQYIRAFDTITSKFIDGWQRAVTGGGAASGRCHPDLILGRILESDAHIFAPVDPPPTLGAGTEASKSPATPGTAPRDASSDSAAKAVCWSWLSNGGCKAHGDGLCNLMHPESMRGQSAGGSRAAGKARANNNNNNNRNSGGGGGYGGYGAPSHYDPWSAYYYPPPWGGKGDWGGWGGGKGGKGNNNNKKKK